MSTELKSSPPSVHEGKGMPLMIGAAMGLGIFILLPVAQWIDSLASSSDRRIEFADLPPPPPPIIIEEPEDEEQEKEEIEDLKEQPPPPSLDMLELAINADMSSLMQGDFQMPQINVGDELAEMVYEIKDLDKPPRPLVQTRPVYPADLQRAGIGGMVRVQFIVDPNGNVRDARIIESTNPGFNDNVLRAVRTWKFEPGEKGGRKVNTRVEQPFPFNVRS